MYERIWLPNAISFLSPVSCVELRLALLVRDLVEPRPENAHRGVAVPELRPLVLARHHDPRREMRDPHRRIRGVDTPWPPGPEERKTSTPELVVADHDLDVLDLAA